MRALRRPGERGQLRRRDQLLEVQAQLGPGGCKALARPAGQIAGELAGAEASEPAQDRLLLVRGRSAGLLDLLQQPDRGQVLGCTGAPARRQGALAGEPPGDRRQHRRLGLRSRFRVDRELGKSEVPPRLRV